MAKRSQNQNKVANTGTLDLFSGFENAIEVQTNVFEPKNTVENSDVDTEIADLNVGILTNGAIEQIRKFHHVSFKKGAYFIKY